MFTCWSSGVSFLRNFPKYRVHFAAALSLSLSLSSVSSCYSDVICSLAHCWFLTQFLHCSLLRGDGGVVVGFVFVSALCFGVIQGVVLQGLRKNLTNFKCLFCFVSFQKCFCVRFFLFVCV